METSILNQKLTDYIKVPCDKLTDYIRVYDGIADKRFCDDLIANFEYEEHNQNPVDREKRPTFTELNISQQYNDRNTRWMIPQQESKQIFLKAVNEYMDELDLRDIDFPPKYLFEEFRIKRYLDNGNDEFLDHVDVGDHSSARRFLVCFLYLNDVEEGGTTDFPKLDLSITPKCGRMLVFPPTWMFRHAGRPVTKGKKYILGTYSLPMNDLKLLSLAISYIMRRYSESASFLRTEYFQTRCNKVIFLEIHEYVSQYDALPSLNAIGIECQERTDLSEEQFKEIIEVLNELSDDPSDYDCSLILRKSGVRSVRSTYRLWNLSRLLTGKIPRGIRCDSFDSFGGTRGFLDQHVGHDYVSDAAARYDFYHRKEDKIPFGLELFDKITKGGLPNKTLNVALAGQVSVSLCSCATLLVVFSFRGRMFYTLLWRWQKKRLQKGLTQTF